MRSRARGPWGVKMARSVEWKSWIAFYFSAFYAIMLFFPSYIWQILYINFFKNNSIQLNTLIYSGPALKLDTQSAPFATVRPRPIDFFI